jgi:hypothetical protein
VDIEALNGYVNDVHEDMCKIIPDNPCIGAALGILCFPNPVHYSCLNIGLVAKIYAWGLFVHASIAFQVIDETYDMATLGKLTRHWIPFCFSAKPLVVDH